MNIMTRKSANGAPGSERCVLITGGAGYIGSHTVLQLLTEGYKVVAIDNFHNSGEEAIRRVTALAGKNGRNLYFFKVDMCNKEALEKIFTVSRFDAVIHCAGVKAVGESVKMPLLYYSNNIGGTLNLLQLMVNYGCKKLVFSSSATVYGQPDSVPCTEDFPVKPGNPYGRTKLFIEEISRDLQRSDPDWRVILLRYFNPVGAHPSGLIGEDPRGIPNNLMPYMQQVAVGRRKELVVYGNDYPTKDGTGVRDYLHVQDLATGHSAALDKILNSDKGYCNTYNLGTGYGTSVFEMVAAFEKACGKKIAVRVTARRPGDASVVYSSVQKAETELGWKAKYDVEKMCHDLWNWVSKHPHGYTSQADSTNSGEDGSPQATAGSVLGKTVST